MTDQRHPYAQLAGGTDDHCHSADITLDRDAHLIAPPPKDRRYITLSSGHRLWFDVFGDGPKRMLLIMGMAASHVQYEPTFVHFGIQRGSEYSVAVMDNRGVGFSDTPVCRYTSRLLAQDCLLLLDELDWHEGVHVSGFSLGGMIALELASIAPSRLGSLTLMSTTAGGILNGCLRAFPPVKGLSGIMRTFKNFKGHEAVDAGLELLFPPEYLDQQMEGATLDSPRNTLRWEHAKGLITRARKYVESGHYPDMSLLGTLLQICAVATHYVCDARLAIIGQSMPVLVVAGGKDRLVRTSNANHMGRVMGAKRVLIFNDAGHAVHEQHAEVVNKAMEILMDSPHSRIEPTPFDIDVKAYKNPSPNTFGVYSAGVMVVVVYLLLRLVPSLVAM